jgi:oligopeptide transport system substrate-binding protein
MHTRRGFLAGASSLVLLAACGQDATQTQTAGGEVVLNWGNAAEPTSLNPHLAQGTWDHQIIADLFNGLVTEDVAGRPIAAGAERWETSEDGLTWTFHLRPHNWSDGQPVKASDYVFAWRRILEPQLAAPYAYFLYPIKNARAVNAGDMPGDQLGVSAPDAQTLVVQLEHPAPYLLEFMTHYTTFPLPQHVLEANPVEWTKPGLYTSNGPFMLTEYVPNDRVVAVKNPHFFEADQIQIDRVNYYPTTDYEAALRRMRAGELDFQDRLPHAQIDWIRANMPDTLHLDPISTIEYYTINQKRPPFNNVRVREALSLALDRETIVNTIRKLGEPPAYNMIPPGTANFAGGNALPFRDTPYPERVARAKQLMEAAGFGPQKRLATVLRTRSLSAEQRRIPAAVQQMWREIYVDIEIVAVDPAQFYDLIQEHDFEIAQAGWQGDYNDASNFLDLLRIGNSNNYGEYENRAYDALLDRAAAELNLETRGRMLAEAEAMALRDHAWIPSFFWVSNVLVQPYLKGFESNVTDKHRIRWMSIDQAEKARVLQQQR